MINFFARRVAPAELRLPSFASGARCPFRQSCGSAVCCPFRFAQEDLKPAYPTFRRCPQENNIFLAIVFGYLLKSLKLLSQLKLSEIEAKKLSMKAHDRKV